MKIDLHLHSSASDGTNTPAEVARLAYAAGMGAIALTDHDNVAGIGECARECERLGLEFVPGVEISAGGDREIHVLGYGIDHEKLGESLRALKDDRAVRMERIVEKVREQGMEISMDDVRKIAAGAPLGRPHIALAMVVKGYASSVKNAFDRYLGDGRSCCVPREKMSFARAAQLIHDAGGAAVVAHPALIKIERRMLTQLLLRLKDQGADGIEAFHSSHTPSDARELLLFARRHDMLVTGGSDFHGRVKSVEIGDGLAAWTDAQRDFAALREFCNG